MGHAFRAHAQKQHVKPRAHTGERTDEDSGEVRGHLRGGALLLALSSLLALPPSLHVVPWAGKVLILGPRSCGSGEIPKGTLPDAEWRVKA